MAFAVHIGNPAVIDRRRRSRHSAFLLRFSSDQRVAQNLSHLTRGPSASACVHRQRQRFQTQLSCPELFQFGPTAVLAVLFHRQPQRSAYKARTVKFGGGSLTSSGHFQPMASLPTRIVVPSITPWTDFRDIARTRHTTRLSRRLHLKAS